MANHVWISATSIHDVPVRQGRAVLLAGRDIAIFNLGDRVLATDNRCPHEGAPLCDGVVAGDAVVCPMHAWKIDLRSGNVQRPAGRGPAVATYRARVEDDTIFVAVPAADEDADRLAAGLCRL